MNKYDYLINTHDLETLSDWGPFARDVYALSHIADRKRGVKFDFLFIPGILRRSFFPPETLRECGCSPYEAAPDLSYFSFRQQLEGQDIFYADSSYADIGGNLWLGRCEFVNNTSELRACALLAVTRLAPRPDVVPFIPENSRFIDALDYSEIEFSYNRFDHNLTFAGGRRGEQNYPGTKALMIGRGLLANPALAQAYAGGTPLTLETLRAFHDDLLREYLERYPKNVVVARLREVMKNIACSFENNAKPLKAVRKASNLAQYEDAVNRLFDECPLSAVPQFIPET